MLDGIRWFPLAFANAVPQDAWLELAYRSSLFDPLTRPLLRFETSGDAVDARLPAPALGRASWIGYAPPDTVRVLLSPGHAEPDAGFELETCRRLSALSLLQELVRRGPWQTVGVAATLLFGTTVEARRKVRWILDGIPLSAYDRWRACRTRALDVVSLDRPRVDGQEGSQICVVLNVGRDTAGIDLSRTIDSLRDQVYPNWHVVYVGPTDAVRRSAKADALLGSGGASLLPSGSVVEDLGPSGRPIVTAVQAGDRLPAWAFALVAHRAAANPTAAAIYGDEESFDGRGRYCDPEFKPDWSPVFQQTAHYAGRAVYYSGEALMRHRALALARLSGLAASAEGQATLLALGADHVRRVLLSKPRSKRARRSKALPRAGRGLADRSPASAEPAASIIIPTRDRADLMARCTGSLSRTLGPRFEVIVVDNGSTEPATSALYDRLRADRRYVFVNSPGPFNYSHLCNLGAARARAPVLVFLNNDTMVLSDGWLAALLARARAPDVGAVGARLLYPSGRVQHAGVVLGLNGIAGHCDLGAGRREPGYLGGLLHGREVSAVTGACLAVARSKFDAVGGLDEVALPVDLNDIDLCLRLAERGWKTIYEPAALLVHDESATRGRTADHVAAYGRELSYFASRWRGRLHDDRFYHPALSLNARRTMLG
jgi:GT2 family glycosyltransferase